jgi:hypothetical protein
MTENLCIKDRSVVIAARMDDRKIVDTLPTKKKLSILPSVKTSSGAHPVSYPMGTGGLFA